MSEPTVTIDDWGEWTEDEILARHQCSGNQNTEIGILHRGTSDAGPPGWIFAIIEPADEDDVRKGVAPELGVPSRCMSIEISFCPFCGYSLNAS
jgi:hypothetical protein